MLWFAMYLFTQQEIMLLTVLHPIPFFYLLFTVGRGVTSQFLILKSVPSNSFLLQGIFDGNMEAHLKRLVDDGLRLLLPSLKPLQHQRLGGRVAVAVPTAAREPLSALLAAAQRLAPGMRPNAAELAKGLEAVGFAAAGDAAGYTTSWAQRQTLEETRLAAALVEFYSRHNMVKVADAGEIAKCYVDRQASASRALYQQQDCS